MLEEVDARDDLDDARAPTLARSSSRHGGVPASRCSTCSATGPSATLDLLVDARALIPRPETELLVGLALGGSARAATARSPATSGAGPGRSRSAWLVEASVARASTSRCTRPTSPPARSELARAQRVARRRARGRLPPRLVVRGAAPRRCVGARRRVLREPALRLGVGARRRSRASSTSSRSSRSSRPTARTGRRGSPTSSASSAAARAWLAPGGTLLVEHGDAHRDAATSLARALRAPRRRGPRRPRRPTRGSSRRARRVRVLERRRRVARRRRRAARGRVGRRGPDRHRLRARRAARRRRRRSRRSSPSSGARRRCPSRCCARRPRTPSRVATRGHRPRARLAERYWPGPLTVVRRRRRRRSRRGSARGGGVGLRVPDDARCRGAARAHRAARGHLGEPPRRAARDDRGRDVLAPQAPASPRSSTVAPATAWSRRWSTSPAPRRASCARARSPRATCCRVAQRRLIAPSRTSTALVERVGRLDRRGEASGRRSRRCTARPSGCAATRSTRVGPPPRSCPTV